VVRDIERVGDRVKRIENAFEKFQMEYKRDRSEERRQSDMYMQVQYMVQDVLARSK
jgi:Na+/phosphate symporter